MAVQRQRAVAALLTAVAVVAAVVCVLSASDNEAALQEVRLPANKAAVQRPMDSTVVERATSAALMHDIGAFLMRRATTSSDVMRKRMAQARSQHKLAPTQQLYEGPTRGYYKDPAFAAGVEGKYRTRDPDFAKGEGDPAFAKATVRPDMEEFNRAVDAGNMIEEIGSHMQKASEEEMKGSSPDEDDEIDIANRPRAPSWDNVLDKVQKAWDAEKGGAKNIQGSTTIQHGPFAGENERQPRYGPKIERLNSRGRPAGPRLESDGNDDIDQRDTPIHQTPGQPDEDTKWGPKAKPDRKVRFPVENENKGHVPFGGFAHRESNTEGTGTRGGLAVRANDRHVKGDQIKLKDPAFQPPNVPKPVRDESFTKGSKHYQDPDFTHNVRGGELIATKTAVQLAKKAMAEHAKKTKKAPEHSSKHGFDLSKQAADNINRVKIQQLRAATARKERKYKKAMAMMEQTNSHIIKPTPPMGAKKMATIKYIKH